MKTFRPAGTAILGAVAVLVLAAVAAGLITVYSGNGDGPRAAVVAVVAVALLILVVEFVLRPKLRVRPDGVDVVNAWRTIELPWSAVEEITDHGPLELTAQGRRYRVQVAARLQNAWRQGLAVQGDQVQGAPFSMSGNGSPALRGVLAGGTQDPAGQTARLMLQAGQRSWLEGGRSTAVAQVDVVVVRRHVVTLAILGLAVVALGVLLVR